MTAWMRLIRLVGLLAGKPRHVNAQQISPARRDDNAEREQVARAINSLAEKYVANEKNRGEYEREIRRTDRQRLTVEKVTMWAVIVGGLVAIGTLFLVKQSTDAARLAAEAASVSGHAAENQLLITLGQVDQAYEAMRLDKRAWVGMVGDQPRTAIPWTIKAGANIMLSFWIKNFGATPARELNTRTGYTFAPITAEPTQFPYAKSSRTGSMMPGELNYVVVQGDKAVSPEHDLGFGRGLAVFAYGRIDYKDIFNREHTTLFCFRLERVQLQGAAAPQVFPAPCSAHHDAN